jgi:hypothetical protein
MTLYWGNLMEQTDPGAKVSVLMGMILSVLAWYWLKRWTMMDRDLGMPSGIVMFALCFYNNF